MATDARFNILCAPFKSQKTIHLTERNHITEKLSNK